MVTTLCHTFWQESAIFVRISHFLCLLLKACTKCVWCQDFCVCAKAQQNAYQPIVLFWLQAQTKQAFSNFCALDAGDQVWFAFQAQDAARRQMDVDLWKGRMDVV